MTTKRSRTRCWRSSEGAARQLLIGALLGACASQPPSPFYGDERFLVVGVDPDAEANAVVRQLEASGYKLERKLHGQHFSALGAVSAGGVPVKVRVVTARGIALALDAVAATPLQPGVRYALLPPPSSETHDADGDGFEEVFVQLLRDSEAPCIQVYRVRDSGFVDKVPGGVALPPQASASSPVWGAPQFCTSSEPADGGAAAPDAAASAGSP